MAASTSSPPPQDFQDLYSKAGLCSFLTAPMWVPNLGLLGALTVAADQPTALDDGGYWEPLLLALASALLQPLRQQQVGWCYKVLLLWVWWRSGAKEAALGGLSCYLLYLRACPHRLKVMTGLLH